jgi:hypothetical protein
LALAVELPPPPPPPPAPIVIISTQEAEPGKVHVPFVVKQQITGLTEENCENPILVENNPIMQN